VSDAGAGFNVVEPLRNHREFRKRVPPGIDVVQGTKAEAQEDF